MFPTFSCLVHLRPLHPLDYIRQELSIIYYILSIMSGLSLHTAALNPLLPLYIFLGATLTALFPSLSHELL